MGDGDGWDGQTRLWSEGEADLVGEDDDALEAELAGQDSTAAQAHQHQIDNPFDVSEIPTIPPPAHRTKSSQHSQSQAYPHSSSQGLSRSLTNRPTTKASDSFDYDPSTHGTDQAYDSLYDAYDHSSHAAEHDDTEEHGHDHELATPSTSALVPWLRPKARDVPAIPASQNKFDDPSEVKAKTRPVNAPQPAARPIDAIGRIPSFERRAPAAVMARTPAGNGAGGWSGVIPAFR